MAKSFFTLLAALFLLTSPAMAAGDEAAMYKAANDKMMAGMNMQPTGDADRDFVMMMIPHHQGAIDMAKVELQHGHDRELRRLATGIIAAQKKEIAQMKAWQAAHETAGTAMKK